VGERTVAPGGAINKTNFLAAAGRAGAGAATARRTATAAARTTTTRTAPNRQLSRIVAYFVTNNHGRGIDSQVIDFGDLEGFDIKLTEVVTEGLLNHWVYSPFQERSASEDRRG
jgi:hypothetical protein